MIRCARGVAYGLAPRGQCGAAWQRQERLGVACRWSTSSTAGGEVVCSQESAPAPLARRAGLYLQIGKVKLTGLVTFTAACGYVVAGGPLFSTGIVAVSAGTFLQGLSANTLNQVKERDRDRTMKRTRKRPLVTGAVTAGEATLVAAAEVTAGTGCLLLADPMAALLGVACWGLYVGVYTPMKQKHWLNTWAGAVVGAIPPVMGTVAAGAPVLSPVSLSLGGLLYLWQIPHFLSLAYLHRRDYATAGFKMLPSEDVRRATLFSIKYSVYCTALLTFVPLHFSICDPVFAAEALILGAVWTRTAWQFHNEPLRHARNCFLASIIYLPVILVLLVLHAKNRDLSFNPSVFCPVIPAEKAPRPAPPLD
eukprot:Hpha_TRINITY_DN29983_c0_g1::TRINITY_DN29983_c0_g1_i1::g.131847::m.131847/K02257/COX10; protoheme IX farnesyltransferase